MCGIRQCFVLAFAFALFGSQGLLAECPPPYDKSTGKQDPRLESFDRLISKFMKRHEVPGLSLAITNQGKLIYARGYGYANLSERVPVTPDSLFRIASVSKPITAVAVLQLVEQQKLRLQDKVFEVLDYQKEIASLPEFDERLRQVTVEQLLQHRGGWDRQASFDPMFQSVRFAKEFGTEPPADTDTIIRAMLRRKLDFAPGEKYVYSNFGYCLLGRVIEKCSGQTYEAYVKQHVLAPLGVDSMQIGHSLPRDRQPQEVTYYDPSEGRSVYSANPQETVESAYGAWHQQSLDAHGGWLATATDLARFAAALDRPEKCPILSAASLDTMHRPATADREQAGQAGAFYYSLGWANRVVSPTQVNHWHNGSLPGSTATLIRRHDRRNFVVLINTRHTEQAESIAAGVDQLLHEAANQVNHWPTSLKK